MDHPRIRVQAAHLGVAAVSGFCVMVLEFAAVRLMAPVFGQTNYVWSNVIGAILLALSLGYWWGGRLGEKSRTARPLFLGYGAVALWTVGVAFLGPTLCRALIAEGLPEQGGLPLGFTGSLVSSLLLFCPPIFLLGMTSPFLIRLASRRGREGRATGGIYAMGTLGSLAGCYLAPLELLQVLGTRGTLLTAAGLLGVLALGGLLALRRSDAAGEEAAPIETRSTPVGPWFLSLAVLTGLCVTAIEFSAVRFMAPWFGQSNYIWANVIGVMLLALALGSWVGGRGADRAHRPGGSQGRPLYVALAGVGVLVALATWTAPALMEALIPQVADGAPIDSLHILPIAFRGSLVATVLFFGPALLLLGMAPPFLVRMAHPHGHAGRTAGVLFAWTTVGGLLGCFLTAPLLVPALGSRGVLVGAALALVLLSLGGLRRAPAWSRALALLALVLLGLRGIQLATSDEPLRLQPGQMEEIESAYQTVRAVRQEVNLLIPQETEGLAPAVPGNGRLTDTVFLRHDEDAETYQSAMLVDPDLQKRWLSGGRYFEHMALGAFFTRLPVHPTLRILVIGYAGGSVHRTIRDALPPDAHYEMIGVEIDPAVIDMARRHLRHDELEGPHLRLITGEDARTVVNVLPREERFDLILVDAYTRTNYVPFQLATKEFFEDARDHLRPGGWIGVNVLGTGMRSPVADAVANTLASVMGDAFIAPNPAYLGNVILWGSPGAKTGPRIQAGSRLHPGLRTAAFALERLLVRHDPTLGHGIVLTDDLSPSDKLADQELGLSGGAR